MFDISKGEMKLCVGERLSMIFFCKSQYWSLLERLPEAIYSVASHTSRCCNWLNQFSSPRMERVKDKDVGGETGVLSRPTETHTQNIRTKTHHHRPKYYSDRTKASTNSIKHHTQRTNERTHTHTHSSWDIFSHIEKTQLRPTGGE